MATREQQSVNQNVIELNGKRYDATTGKFLGSSTGEAAAHLAAKQGGKLPGAVVSGKAVDGFIRRPGIHADKNSPHGASTHVTHTKAAADSQKVQTAKKANPEPPIVEPPLSAKAARKPNAYNMPLPHKPNSVPKVAKPASMADVKPSSAKPAEKPRHTNHADVNRTHADTPAEQVHLRQPQHSKTLMRAAVKKPQNKPKPIIKPQAPAEIAAKPASSLMRKSSASQIDPARMERAKAVATHSAVRRFHPSSYGMAPMKGAVAQPMVGHVPVIPVRLHPQHTMSVAQRAHHSAPARRTDIFENAIRHAHSHEQPKHKHPRQQRRRMAGTMAGIAALLIFCGFVTYLNVPNIQLKIASVEAGFHASMPSYNPTGYALKGGIKNRGGTVTMRFTSGDSGYQITQQSSSWDSQALLDNTLALSGPHKTVERSGRIIYIYGEGNSKASWVTGNVRYDITGTASLNADELAKIAASM